MNYLDKVKTTALSVLDKNGDGNIDTADIIQLGMQVPRIKIDRSSFLRKELLKRYPKDVIRKAIDESPMKAGIPVSEINYLADEIIKFERNCVSGISTALGALGGFVMAATIPADIVQYYAYLLRATQKLLYLYGFPSLNISGGDAELDTETVNILIVCMGVMYGTAGANSALKGMAKALGTNVEKKLLQSALTKGTIYPIVKKVAQWFGFKMTKEVFAGFFKHAIPVVGGALGGGITYLTFKPCCDKLKDSLKDTILSNPNYREDKNIIDVK